MLHACYVLVTGLNVSFGHCFGVIRFDRTDPLCSCHKNVCLSLCAGAGRVIHPRRRPHRPLLVDHGSGRWCSHVRCPDLQPSPGDGAQTHGRWQVGSRDSSRNHPRQPRRQRHRSVLQCSYPEQEVFSASFLNLKQLFILHLKFGESLEVYKV